jgi:hypothetical protein
VSRNRIRRPAVSTLADGAAEGDAGGVGGLGVTAALGERDGDEVRGDGPAADGLADGDGEGSAQAASVSAADQARKPRRESGVVSDAGGLDPGRSASMAARAA